MIGYLDSEHPFVLLFNNNYFLHNIVKCGEMNLCFHIEIMLIGNSNYIFTVVVNTLTYYPYMSY